MSSQPSTSSFVPLPPIPSTSLPPLPSTSAGSHLRSFPILSSKATFTPQHFLNAALEMTFNPEYLSSTILRADIISDHSTTDDDDHHDEPHSNGKGKMKAFSTNEEWQCFRKIRRRILPKRHFDWSMNQDVFFYRRNVARTEGVPPLSVEAHSEAEELLMVLLPDLEDEERLLKDGKLPFYHPQVAAIFFRFIPARSGVEDDSVIQIEITPLSTAASPPSTTNKDDLQGVDERTKRSCLGLLKFLSSVAHGLQTGYEKHVRHDLLVQKEGVQDLYRILKLKYQADLSIDAGHDPRITFPRWMAKEWKEVTDPSKHLFEDVAIAAWLIIVWKDLYPENGGKPPGGFVDIGCGNGLLVHLLSLEGFPGYGIDLRARKSWEHYSPRPDFRVVSLDPPTLLSTSISTSSSPFPENSFLIGNHADELTPWIPLFAAFTKGSSFLNIPCCHHTLSDKFTRLHYTIPEEFLTSISQQIDPTHHPDSKLITSDSSSFHEPKTNKESSISNPSSDLMYSFFAPSPQLSTGRAHAYQLYLAHLTLLSGFLPEREALRIPSTKNFGFLGRKRILPIQNVKKGLEKLIEENRMGWKARIPEGKAGLTH